MKKWELHELEPNRAGEQRWSMGAWGPRAYLTCDKITADLILKSVNREIALGYIINDLVKKV